MYFTIDFLALGLLLSLLLAWGLLTMTRFSNSSTPSLAFSWLKYLHHPSWRSQLTPLSKRLYLAGLIGLMIAFIDPHILFPRSSASSPQHLPIRELPTEGIAIYLALDQSGSMAESVSAPNVEGRIQSIPKIDLLKEVTKQFIIDHPSDLIGLVSFARVPKVLVPLTLDQETLLSKLKQISVVKRPEDDGTGIGYAIYKTAQLIAATRHFSQDLRQDGQPPYTIKSAVIIVVTDGFQDPSRLDLGNRLRTIELDDAADFAKSENIRLYVINIDPAMASSTYAPHRRQLKAITASTGGQFYIVSDSQGLKDIYASIDKLEKGTIPQEATLQAADEKSNTSRYSLYPFFLLIGMSCLLAALFLDSFILKRVP